VTQVCPKTIPTSTNSHSKVNFDQALNVIAALALVGFGGLAVLLPVGPVLFVDVISTTLELALVAAASAVLVANVASVPALQLVTIPNLTSGSPEQHLKSFQ
jgi:hypothetical protein